MSDAGHGFLRRVVSVEQSSKTITLKTENATLPDVIEQGETETVFDFGTEALRSASVGAPWPGLSASSLTPSDVRVLGTHPISVDLAGTVIWADSAVGGSVRITKGVFTFAPALDVGLTIQGGTTFRAILNGSLGADLEVEVNCAGPIRNRTIERTIWSSPEVKIPLPPIGPVPIALHSKLYVNAGVTFDASGRVKVTIGATSTTNTSLGVRYEGGSWEMVKTFEPSWQHNWNTSDDTVLVHATAYLQGGIQLGFFGGVDLGFLGGKQGLDGTADVTAQPYVTYAYEGSPPWSLKAGFRSDFTAALRVLGIFSTDLAGYKTNLFMNEWPLEPPNASEMSPPPGPTGDCNDGESDSTETGTDCGGPNACRKCADGEGCVIDDDCVSAQCVAGVCTTAVAASCSNGVKDNDETEIDCGGSCLKCNGESCSDGECRSGICELNPADTGQHSICLPPIECWNGNKDANETDVDCGGGDCWPCDDGGACLKSSDCADGACVNRKCQAFPANCGDGVQDGDETAADCGGSCPPCAMGGSDCSNGVQDGLETGIDCGGPCAACGATSCEGAACSSPSECCSDLTCSRYTGTCVAAVGLPLGDYCSEPGQCASGLCYTGNGAALGWCTDRCSGAGSCDQYTECVQDTQNGWLCYPACASSQDCAIYGASIMCHPTAMVCTD